MIKKILSAACICLAALLCGYILNDVIKDRRETAPVYSGSISTLSSAATRPKADAAQVLAHSLTPQAQLITSEIQIACQLLVQDNWMELDIFSKEQPVSFNGTAIYTIDLAGLAEDAIKTGDGDHTLTVAVDGPKVYHIYMDPDSIEIGQVKNGIFRFGPAKLSAEDMKSLLLLAEDHMQAEAAGGIYYEMAKTHASEAIRELFEGILTSAGFLGYEVVVVYP